MEAARTDLYSEKVAAGGRTYFFDVKQAKGGAHYLAISESRPKEGGGFDHHRLMVFQENIAAFGTALQKAAGFMQGKSS